MMIKRVGIGVAVVAVIAFLVVFVKVSEPEPIPADMKYSMTREGSSYIFNDYINGLKLELPEEMKVDQEMAEVYTVLENDNTRIELFDQALDTEITGEVYSEYSNRFLRNRYNHRDVEKRIETTEPPISRTVYIAEWRRPVLSRVENDLNHYVCFDIIVNQTRAVTILIKSNEEISEDYYRSVLNSFSLINGVNEPEPFRTEAQTASSQGWNQETIDFFNTYYGGDSDFTFGIFENESPLDFSNLHAIEDTIDYEFPILLNYSSFESTEAHPNLDQRLDAAYADGKTLELTLQTNADERGKGNTVYRILDGEYDSFLRDYAKKVADFGHPVMFRLGNEMNGDWCPYSSFHTSRDPMIFKEFYRYVTSFFDEAGADNVIYVWNPNGRDFPDFTWNNELMYYPGDEYADIVGMTLYNTGDYYDGEIWEEFDEMYEPLYDEYTKKYDQPLMITEFSSAIEGGDKVEWVTNMFESLQTNYPKIKVAVWWHGADLDQDGTPARVYFIDQPRETLDVFRKYLGED